jgi:hypothetical protein
MKNFIALILFLSSFNLFAQKPCDYSTNVNDSIGTYKSTKEYIISEKHFGGNSSYVFYSLALTDGTPSLNVQLLSKSKEFIKANCFDKNSKIFLQLTNGKIITLLHNEEENCGTMLRDDNGFDNRINSGTFLFIKGSFEELKQSTVSLMRIKYLTDIEDYVLSKELKSELDSTVYYPENYFIDNIRCVEN